MHAERLTVVLEASACLPEDECFSDRLIELIKD